ncbi:hypothetical protein ACFOWE_23260 [Planomonospora corallina]|uniref:Uncharacterized protein n=1 Tax=Planomonospora corallina TaxID=1806052 RepID=A0ABV8IAI3_9ACTN
MSEQHDPAETSSSEPSQPEPGAGRSPESDAPPIAPDAAVGESRTVAERSGADTDFPARPIPADPVTPSPPLESPEGEDEERSGTPAPDMGPSS